ncbi:MAG: HEAT repeat domain-containing protein [Armatimonadetes bacterium]|nr:HEAT repeat domain-containing protein [Armatimonadota bacterium]
MVNPNPDGDGSAQAKLEGQPPALKQLLASVNVARKQISMYGTDHPNSVEATTRLADCVEEFTSNFDRATCVFTNTAIIVNEHYYAGSRDSADMCQRLRVRGVMAITFIGSRRVLASVRDSGFLNIEPKEVRAQEGPSTFLRRRGVSRIVLTETIYTASDGEQSNDGNEQDCSGVNEDRVIAAVIDWLSKNDDENEDDEPARKLPVSQVLSDPDSAARLIREAVTKLHVSRRKEAGESATEVVQELKALMGEDHDEWDNVTPQIRKAMSKLPKEMRPSAVGFMFEEDENEDTPSGPRKTTGMDEAEAVVHELMEEVSTSATPEEMTAHPALEKLFGARAEGMLSSWRRELQPTSVMESSGRTLGTLMTWESSACEHGRIAQATAVLIARALEAESFDIALALAVGLLSDAEQDEELGWRRTNVKAALTSIDSTALSTLVREAAKSKHHTGIEIAASILKLIPQMAMTLTDLVGTREGAGIAEPLKGAIRQLGQGALSALANLLHDGSPAAREAALTILIDSGRGWAIEEIASVMKAGDPMFIIKALAVLPRVRIPLSTETCLGALAHPMSEVRCAAIAALGEMQDISALPQLIRAARRYSAFTGPRMEHIAAINAIGRFRDPEARDCLKKIANCRPLIGRARYEPVRRAAEQALETVNADNACSNAKAA